LILSSSLDVNVCDSMSEGQFHQLVESSIASVKSFYLRCILPKEKKDDVRRIRLWEGSNGMKTLISKLRMPSKVVLLFQENNCIHFLSFI
jgi:hypothetical protein